MTDSFHAQTAMFPHMVNTAVRSAIDTVKERCLGYKLSGAGGGGYLVIFGNEVLPGALRVKIRRSN
jgi:galactokinase/mevalonate kinase-like predicted kinase